MTLGMTKPDSMSSVDNRYDCPDFNCSFFVISDRVVLSDLQRQKHRVTSEDCGELQFHLDNKPSFTGSFDQVPLGQQRDHAI